MCIRDRFEQARVAARRDGDRGNEFLALEHLVRLEMRRGRFERAAGLCEDLAVLAAGLRQDGSEAPCARLLGALCRTALSGGFVESQGVAEGLEALAAADAKHRLAFALLVAAELDLRARQHHRAATRTQQALDLAMVLQLPREVAAAEAMLLRIRGLPQPHRGHPTDLS